MATKMTSLALLWSASTNSILLTLILYVSLTKRKEVGNKIEGNDIHSLKDHLT